MQQIVRTTGVDELAELVGLTRRRDEPFEWNGIEARLGRRLPDDYKDLLETFPRGRFQATLELVRPGEAKDGSVDYLASVRALLDDMREWRADEGDRFPFALHPEPGGLLPWGRTMRGDPFFWATDAEEPNLWNVVTTDVGFTRWQRFPVALCQFLKGLVTGQIDGSNYAIPFPAERFEELGLMQPVVTPRGGFEFWHEMRPWPSDLQNQYELLADRLGEPSETPLPLDWHNARRIFGGRFPSDYEAFLERYGCGDIGDIMIVAPNGPSGANSIELLESLQGFQGPGAGWRSSGPPVYPDKGGLIPWGRTSDYQVLCWAPSDENPDNWGIVIVDGKTGDWSYKPDATFSSLLVKYIDPTKMDPIRFRDVERRFPMRFAPF